MSRLTWSERDYSSGLDRGVFFANNGLAQAWNGLVSVAEKTEDVRTSIRYFDGVKIINLASGGSYVAAVQAFTYPDELSRRLEFGFSWREQSPGGYSIHLVYNARGMVQGLTYEHETIEPFTIDITTRPVVVPDAAPTAHLIVDSKRTNAASLEVFESILYGNEAVNARLPTPDEIYQLIEVNATLRVIDNGDGSFEVIGPDEAVIEYPDGTFSIDWPSVMMLDSETYQIRSQ